MKKFLTIMFSLLLVLPAFSREAAFSTSEEYSISLMYNDSASSGDAVFIKMKINQGKKSTLSKDEFSKTTAKASLYLKDKLLDASDFYILPDESSKNKLTMLTGIPLSSWWKQQEGYGLKIKFKFSDGKENEFELPFTVLDKEFFSETIELNSQNTAIKTDTSPTRMTQIDRLNEVLKTKDAAGVHQTKPFVPPTASKRFTSNFADRRVYAYSNGKSSTSLHYGIDYGIPEGSTVTACAGGKVVMAEERISTGYSVVIEHLPGLYSLYYHLSSMNVKTGDKVKAGDLIGKSGSTGLATGPHLHWEMRLNMCAVNPEFFTGDFAFEKF